MSDRIRGGESEISRAALTWDEHGAHEWSLTVRKYTPSLSRRDLLHYNNNIRLVGAFQDDDGSGYGLNTTVKVVDCIGVVREQWKALRKGKLVKLW
jgi:hypothetical protein